LKFLPKRLAEDPRSLERFRGEVRLARRVSHPNVSRVCDIGQIDGHWFLSMEYVDSLRTAPISTKGKSERSGPSRKATRPRTECPVPWSCSSSQRQWLSPFEICTSRLRLPTG
jgi:serine/threonine protein kinase